MAAGNIATQQAQSWFILIWESLKDIWYLWLLLAIAIIVFIAYRKSRAYPLRAVIFEKRGEGVLVNLNRRLGRKVVDGLECWQLKGSFKQPKENLQPQHYDTLAKCIDATGCAFLVKVGAGQYHPLDPSETIRNGTFRIIDVDDWNWKVLEGRATDERHKARMTLLQQYLPAIILIIAGIIIVVTMIISYGLIRDQAAIAKAAADAAVTSSNNQAVPANPAPAKQSNNPLDIFKTS